jgi:micrococcal nuclease
MQILRTATLAAMALVQLLQGTTRSDPVLVKSVIDGDTVDVATIGRVRLLGIDAPELGRGYDTPAPWAYEAKDRLAQLVLNHFVRLEQDGDRFDAYSRHLAYLLLEDGTFINATLVREGLARVTARVPLSRLPELRRAEADAQSSRRGMWGATPQIPPPPGYTRRAASAPRSRATPSRGSKASSPRTSGSSTKKTRKKRSAR